MSDIGDSWREPRTIALDLTCAERGQDAPRLRDAIEDEIQLSYLATIMGTSIVQIEDTYARWLKRTDEHLREVFAAGDARRLGPGLGPTAAENGHADERT